MDSQFKSIQKRKNFRQRKHSDEEGRKGNPNET